MREIPGKFRQIVLELAAGHRVDMSRLDSTERAACLKAAYKLLVGIIPEEEWPKEEETDA